MRQLLGKEVCRRQSLFMAQLFVLVFRIRVDITTMIDLYRYCSYAYKYTTKMVDVLFSNNC